jgi:acyl-CoA synthetase (AMP-forming)/AMP-acid ligase II/acyl carrier protein
MYQYPDLNQFTNLVDLARWQAEHNPDQKVITFLPDGEETECDLTFRKLDEQARFLAAWIQNQLPAGERAVLLIPPGLDFVTGIYSCLYAGLIAVVISPPQSNASLANVEVIVDQSQTKLILTTSEYWHSFKDQIRTSSLSKVKLLFIDQIPANIHLEDWQSPQLSQSSVAFLIYTSGSTSSPKGVILTHHNILNEMATVIGKYHLLQETVVVSWAPPYHAAGIFWFFLILGTGLHFIWMPTKAFLEKPARWFNVMTKYKCNYSLSFNFGLQTSMERVPSEAIRTFDLSHLKGLFLGGELLRYELIDRFAKVFAECGLHREALLPVYAMTEATYLVSAKDDNYSAYALRRSALQENKIIQTDIHEEDSQIYMGCGRTIANISVVIVDPETKTRCLPDQIGEIWISGPGVASGYWNRKEETEANFKTYLENEGPYFRTGDLGAFHGEDLIITGRLKEMIIIRGKNFYSQDFERSIQGCHPALISGGTVAFAIMENNEERLAVAAEVKPEISDEEADQIIIAIRSVIGKIQQQSVHVVALVKPGELARTPSGKPQRFKTRSDLLAGQLKVIKVSWLHTNNLSARSGKEGDGYVAPGSSIERALVRIWSSVLHLEKIGVTDNFFELGGDSLSGTQILTQIQEVFQVEISPRSLFETPTIKDIARLIIEKRQQT